MLREASITAYLHNIYMNLSFFRNPLKAWSHRPYSTLNNATIVENNILCISEQIIYCMEIHDISITHITDKLNCLI